MMNDICMNNICINDIDKPIESLIKKISELNFSILEFEFKTPYRLPNGKVHNINIKIHEGY